MFYLKVNYDKSYEYINVKTGEVNISNIEELIKIQDTFFVEDLDLIFPYFKRELFNLGYSSTFLGEELNDDKCFEILCSHNKIYLIKINNFCIKGISNLVPDLDYDEFEEDRDNTNIMVINRLKELKINGLTAGSSAYNSWKFLNKTNRTASKFRFNDNLIEDKEDLKIIRESYKGGLNFVNENKKWSNKKSITIDNNSLYAFNLLKGNVPYGKPQKMSFVEFKAGIEKRKDFPYTVYSPKYKTAIVVVHLIGKVKDGFYPIIGEKNEYTGKTIYHENINGVYSLWYEELLKVREIYNIEYELDIQALAFQVCDAKIFFGEYFDKYKKMKENSNNYLDRKIAKQMLNGLIGKFATKNIHKNQIEVRPNEYVFFETENYDYYCALTSYVNSQSRIMMIDFIISFEDDFIYTDTDSITFEGEEIPFWLIFSESIDDREFGKFKIESENEYFHLIRCKQYEKKTKNGIKRVLAGCPRKQVNNFTEFKRGVEFDIEIWSFDEDLKPIKIKTKYSLGYDYKTY